jgi:hypothetical protein
MIKADDQIYMDISHVKTQSINFAKVLFTFTIPYFNMASSPRLSAMLKIKFLVYLQPTGKVPVHKLSQWLLSAIHNIWYTHLYSSQFWSLLLPQLSIIHYLLSRLLHEYK